MISRRQSAKARRRTLSIESMQNARNTIGPLHKDMSIFAMTRGQFSMIDVINALLDQISYKGADTEISVWTWAIADYDIEVLSQLMERQEITRASLIIDISAEGRNADLMAQWRDRFGADTVKSCRNHAKITRIWNNEWQFLARGSMNLNYNPRFEQFDLTEGGNDFDIVAKIESELPILPPGSGPADADRATGVGTSWQKSELELLRSIKTWQL